jgi:hypothetical protein
LSGNWLPGWRCACIVHLRSHSRSDGHFVVLMPNTSPGVVTIWDGLAGFQCMPQVRLRDQMSGVVLLTSPRPIDTFAIETGHNRRYTPKVKWFLVGVLVVAVAAVLRLR